MCRPIPGNSVRPKSDFQTKPLQGSSPAFRRRKSITLRREMRGMAEGPCEDPDFFFVIFEFGASAVVRARVHHTQMKGIEA